MAINPEKLNDLASKYENYIKKNPNESRAYYYLGKIKMNLGKYKEAQECFEKSISLNPNFTWAKVELIVANVFRKRFVQAVNLYTQYRMDISVKNIFNRKLVRGVTEFYSRDDFFSQRSKELFSPLFHKMTIQPLLSKYGEDPGNVVLILILAMYYMAINEKSLDIMNILKICVYMDSVDDNMRWSLLKAIADCGEKLYLDLDIASKFTSIPEPDCTDEYVKTIFGAVVLGRNKYKVKNIYNSMRKQEKKLTLRMMWKYVDWAWNVELYDLSVYECCSELLLAGWADILVLEMMEKLVENNITTVTDEELKILNLFGYLNKKNSQDFI
ncbi:tetratricopeptide repeat protein [Acetivibrio clariflavus]|uniref:tetratricopeptide repeat protein n=1 Tax=Acetivibrio clariflavus TaxID=288965 RepID=UPI0004AE47F6|nr:tetratricopeptide repeat protein [Acetivibrio clariflavus]